MTIVEQLVRKALCTWSELRMQLLLSAAEVRATASLPEKQLGTGALWRGEKQLLILYFFDLSHLNLNLL